MRALLLLCCIVYSNAQLRDLGKGVLIHLGPFDTSAQIGNLTPRYVPLSNDDLISSRNARTLVEDVRRLFHVGFNILPPLDPYTKSSLPPLSLDNYFKVIKGVVHLDNLVVGGAKRFIQNLLEIRLKTGRVDFGFSIPSLNVNVDLQADLMLADVLPIHLKGHLSLLLNGVKVVGSVHVVPLRIGKQYYYQVVAVYYRLHIEDVAVQLKGSNLNINKLVKDSILLGIDLAGDILPESLFNKLIQNINNYVANIILQEANSMLMIASSKQVLAYLLPQNIS